MCLPPLQPSGLFTTRRCNLMLADDEIICNALAVFSAAKVHAMNHVSGDTVDDTVQQHGTS